jgi:hypothetical protein
MKQSTANKPTTSDWARLFAHPGKDSGSRVTAKDLTRVFGGGIIKKHKSVVSYTPSEEDA